MRIGLMIGGTPVPDRSLNGLVKLGQRIEQLGLKDLWMAHISDHDALLALAIIGRETHTLGLGTAVTAVYPRHPLALAQQALSAGTASNGRFKLGIGLAHKVVVENSWGFSYDKPAKYMREYLTVLSRLMAGEKVSFEGKNFNVHGLAINISDPQPVPILLAALGPVMLKLAGEMGDGTITWMSGEKTLGEYIIPSINQAADNAGKPPPSIVACVPLSLTNNVDAARESLNKKLMVYGQLPSYRAMLDREGATHPAEVSLVGDEVALRAGIQRLKDIGVTDFGAAIVAEDDAEFDRTLEFLGSECGT